MWIRSQNKAAIHNVHSVWLDPVGEDSSIYNLKCETHPNGPDDMGWILGTFPTEEAVLEELDAIERAINAGLPIVYQVSQP
jgi:hypothetical protein